MYQAFFGLREKPFNLTPDPKFLYLNSSYREALAALHYAIAERKGFAALVGEAGCGKTTLLRRLLSELPRDTRSVLVINPAVSFEELLRFILTDLGRPPSPGTSKLQMTEALNDELLDTLARGGNVVVLIDEAQDLTIPVLEELRLLSNLETAKEKILQFVLAGQPEFESMLSRPEIRQLRQRIAVNARLRPLGRGEVKAYVAARIAAAGGDERGLFRADALHRLWRFSRGVPRLVNVACDNALVTAYAAGKRTVGWKAMGEAVRDLVPASVPGSRFAVPAFMVGVLLAAAVLGLGGAYAVSRLAAPPRVETVPAVAAPPARVAEPPVAPPSARQEPSVAAPAVERREDAAVQPRAGRQSSVGALVPREAVASEGRAEDLEAVPAAAEPPVEVALEAEQPPTEAVEVAARPAAESVVAPEPVKAVEVEPAPEPVEAAEVEPAPVPVEAAEVESPPEPVEAAEVEPAPVPEPAEASRVRYVRVERGDTITGIAMRHYGSVTAELLGAIKAANPGLRDIDVIDVGGTIVLPAADQVADLRR